MTSKRLAHITLYTGLALFLISLTQVSYCTQSCSWGVSTLLLGWIGMLIEFGNIISAVMGFLLGNDFTLRNPVGATFSWLANPLLILAFLAIRRDAKIAMRLALVATAFMLSFLLFDNILDKEAGGYATITGYGAGYWLWLLSSVTTLAGSAVLWLKHRGQPVADTAARKRQYTK